MRHVPHLRPGTRYHDTPHLCCRRQFHFRAALFSPSTRASSNTVTVQHSIMIRLLDIIFSRSGFGECGAPKLNHHNFFFFSCMLYLCMHAGSISVDFSRNIASEHWRRRAGRMKLTNKQVPSVQFLLNRAAHPQSDHMSNFSINAAGATGTVHPSSSLSSSSSAAAASAATASQRSRYVLYIMRRRNKLVLVPVSSVTGRSNGQHGHHSTTTSHIHTLQLSSNR